MRGGWPASHLAGGVAKTLVELHQAHRLGQLLRGGSEEAKCDSFRGEGKTASEERVTKRSSGLMFLIG